MVSFYKSFKGRLFRVQVQVGFWGFGVYIGASGFRV